jgi:hypothetical protein
MTIVDLSPPAVAQPALGHKGEMTMATANQQGTTTLQLVLAWGFVGIPLTLGVIQTLINSMKLFQ